MILASVYETLTTCALVANCLIALLLAYGLWKRHSAGTHVPVMAVCIALDLSNVVLVEIAARLAKRAADDPNAGAGAVEQGVRSLIEDPLSILNLHILVSTVCIVCYIVAVVTGRKMLKSGMQAGRRVHKANACVFIVTRLASLVTSFFV